jgi:ribosomal protein S18 acetylase RimI-like enzyme
LEDRDLEALSREVGLSRHHLNARWQERLSGHETMLVAVLSGALVGSVSIEEKEDQPGLLHLYALGVSPAFQNRGIGSAIVAHVEAEAARRGLAGVFMGVALENGGARRLYERLGYSPEGALRESRWTWEGPDGETREVVETVQRMFKRFGGE